MTITGPTSLTAPAPEVAAPPSPAAELDRHPRRTRPMNQYWDVTTATWRTVSVIPTPRIGD
jgi:hypothetical protein